MIKFKSPYVFLILFLLISFLIFSVWSARQAATRGSRISDTEYYSKGLKYTNTKVEERAATSRGWNLETNIVNKNLHFILSDKEGNAISQANGELTLYLGKEKKVLRLKAIESQPGLYWIDLPDEINGSLQARIEFELQGSRINRQLLVNL